MFDDTGDDEEVDEDTVAVVVFCRSSRRCSRPTLSRRLAVLSDIMWSKKYVENKRQYDAVAEYRYVAEKSH